MKATASRFGWTTRSIGAMVALTAASAGAATYTWDGGGTDNKITTAKNWVGDAVVMGSYDYVFGDSSLRATADSGNGGNNRDIGKYTLTSNGFTFIHSGNGSLRLMAPVDVNYVSLEVDTAGTNTFSMTTLVMKNQLIGTGNGCVVFNSYVSFESAAPYIGCPATLVFQSATGNGSGSTRTFTITNNPTILVNNTSGSGLGQSTINLNSGTVGGAGIIAPGDATHINNFTVAAGARLSPGDNYFTNPPVGTLTFAFANAGGRLVLQTNSLFSFDLATPSASDKIAITAGGLTLNKQAFSNFSFNALPGFGAGIYTLFDSVLTAGTLGSNTTGTVAGHKATLQLAGNNLVLNVTSSGTAVMFR